VPIILDLDQFRAHRDRQGSHLGGHIVCFYNVKGASVSSSPFDVKEEGDEEMGASAGYIYGGVPGSWSESPPIMSYTVLSRLRSAVC
jgi:hypothetical protein